MCIYSDISLLNEEAFFGCLLNEEAFECKGSPSSSGAFSLGGAFLRSWLRLRCCSYHRLDCSRKLFKALLHRVISSVWHIYDVAKKRPPQEGGPACVCTYIYIYIYITRPPQEGGQACIFTHAYTTNHAFSVLQHLLLVHLDLHLPPARPEWSLSSILQSAPLSMVPLSMVPMVPSLQS